MSIEMSVYLKRIFDFTISLFLLVILVPFFVITAILIRKMIGTPVLFRQSRPGMNGKLFDIYKFRSMSIERDTKGELHLDEVRLTRLGQLMRKFSVDELPQLWNVLKGDMSFVGPRPLLIEYLPLYSPCQARRHAVRPGITGWAQVNGRNAISWEQKFDYDVWYVENQSFWLDIKILIMTILKVFKTEGINKQGHVTMTKFEGSQSKIVIVGAGGHSKVIVDCVHSTPDNRVIAILDNLYTEVFHENGIIKGPIHTVYELLEQKNVRVIIGIGSNKIRKEIVDKLNLPNESYATVIHASAIISPNATIDVGTVVMPLVVVNTHASIGMHVILNSTAVIEHNSLVRDFVHISPGAILTGGTEVGIGTHIGTASSIIPSIKVGEWSTVGAGSVVISNLESNIVAAGVPAKIMKREGI